MIGTQVQLKTAVNNRKPTTCQGCPRYMDRCVTYGTWDTNAQVTFIGESPSWASIGANAPFMGENGLLLRKMIHVVLKEFFPQVTDFRYSTAYAAAAQEQRGLKPTKVVLDHCQPLWQSQWCNNYGQQAKTHVLIPLGMLAAKSCGVIGKKITDMRGRIFDVTVGQRLIQAVPTLSLKHLYAKPGLTRAFQSDIHKAFRIALQNDVVKPKSIEELAKNYIIPKTVDEVKELCDYIIGYYDSSKQTHPWSWPVAIDTETNTLLPYQSDAKVLMLSVAWDDGKAAAILLDHPETPYDAKEAWPHVKRLLECPKPKSLHNAKFDLQFLEFTYGARVNNVIWDTMLGEYFLDEDRKGIYGLKAVTPMYLPEYEGYEDTLHLALRGGQKTIEQIAADITPKDEDEDTSTETQEEGEEEEEIEEEEAEPQFDEFDIPVGHPDDWPTHPIETDLSLDALNTLKNEYVSAQTEWVLQDAAGEKKARAKAMRTWSSVAKALGLPKPKPIALEKRSKASKIINYSKIPVQILAQYAGVDADVTRQIQKKQYRRLAALGQSDQAHNVMRELLIPASRTLGNMQTRGVRIDQKRIDIYSDELVKLIEEERKKIYDLTLTEFNLNSKDALVTVLQSCGLTTDKTTATGKCRINKEVLVDWQKLYANATGPLRDDNKRLTDAGRLAVVESYMLYRQAAKMLTSFLKNLKKLSALDGRIHTHYSANGTATGRLSSSNLNLQNIPLYMCRITRPVEGSDEPYKVHDGYNIKALMIPDDPEEELFWNADISGAELRVLAFVSGDKALTHAINTGADVHTIVLTKIKKPELNADLEDPEFKKWYDHYRALYKAGDPDIELLRTASKRTVFGTCYGAGARKIAEQIGDTSPEGVIFAQSVIDMLFKAFPGIKRYIDQVHKEIDRNGQVCTVFGRYRRFWLASVSRKMLNKAYREGGNHLIQSTSSDLVLSGLCELEANAHKIGAKVQLTVHDSFGGSIKKKFIPYLYSFLKYYITTRTREKFSWLEVDWLFDAEVGTSYGEKMKLSDYMKKHHTDLDMTTLDWRYATV